MKSIPTLLEPIFFFSLNLAFLLGKYPPKLVWGSLLWPGSSKRSTQARKIIKLGCPCKLSPTDKRRIVSSITSGKVENAVQATHLINPTLSSPVSAQTVRNVLKSASLKAVVKKKKPLLSVKHRQ